MEQQQERSRMNTPEMQAYRREVEEASFTKEGTMIAFPTCFPGVTTPIIHDESRITALDIVPNGTIYGGTSGYQTHLFAANFYGIRGAVFDFGVVKDANECLAVCCGKSNFAAFVNGPKGGRVIISRNSRIDTDLIEEWGFDRPAFEDLGECVAGEPIVHAVADPESEIIVGTTSKHVFKLDLKNKKIDIVGESPSGGQVARASKGGFVGKDSMSSLWHYNPSSGSFRRGAVKLPQGKWNHNLSWARDNHSGMLYTADEDGIFFSYHEENGFSKPMEKAMLTPVGAMAVTNDRRVFGFCGSVMSKLFCLNPSTGKVSALGSAASIIEHRRYGYEFGDAVTGRDGEIYFAENDNGGHMWMYFPRIMPVIGV
jgi:hypothetical protein